MEEPLVADVPSFAGFLPGSNIDWSYKTLSEPVACQQYFGASCPLPRGKVMGGTSTMNIMLYARGNKENYNDWAKQGNAGWSYDEILPYFKKSEDFRVTQVNFTHKKKLRGP